MFSRLATNANPVETILHGSVGFLTARSGGHLVSLQCYVSPYDVFEEGTGTQLNLTDNNGECSEGCILHVEVLRLHRGFVLPVMRISLPLKKNVHDWHSYFFCRIFLSNLRQLCFCPHLSFVYSTFQNS